jgi:hypothetical protein
MQDDSNAYAPIGNPTYSNVAVAALKESLEKDLRPEVRRILEGRLRYLRRRGKGKPHMRYDQWCEKEALRINQDPTRDVRVEFNKGRCKIVDYAPPEPMVYPDKMPQLIRKEIREFHGRWAGDKELQFQDRSDR